MDLDTTWCPDVHDTDDTPDVHARAKSRQRTLMSISRSARTLLSYPSRPARRGRPARSSYAWTDARRPRADALGIARGFNEIVEEINLPTLLSRSGSLDREPTSGLKSRRRSHLAQTRAAANGAERALHLREATGPDAGAHGGKPTDTCRSASRCSITRIDEARCCRELYYSTCRWNSIKWCHCGRAARVRFHFRRSPGRAASTTRADSRRCHTDTG